jgi:hypothetical protein
MRGDNSTLARKLLLGSAMLFVQFERALGHGWTMTPNVLANRRAAPTPAKLKPRTGPSG